MGHIKRGHVYGTKELCPKDLHEYYWTWREGTVLGWHKTRDTICNVELPVRSVDQDTFTVIEYEGADARLRWVENLQDVAHNSGFGQVGDDWTLWGLWMNMKRGVFCRGPEIYPDTVTLNGESHILSSIEVPHTLEMLQDDTSARFFSSRLQFGVERDILNLAWRYQNITTIANFLHDPAATAEIRGRHSDYPLELWKRCTPLPNDVASLRFDTIYSGSRAIAVWPEENPELSSWQHSSNLVGKTAMPGGVLTRGSFQLQVDGGDSQNHRLAVENDFMAIKLSEAWLSQFPRICATLDRATDDIFGILSPHHVLLCADYWYPAPNIKRALPIFLFVYTPPMTVAEYISWIDCIPYFWSFDETGQTAMSEDERQHWGLPILTPDKHPNAIPKIISWPAHVYESLRTWQKARGFDLTTSDWARELHFPELRVIQPRKEDVRFEVVEVTGD
ncbi:hypothetical protein VNI00_000260 [Paramarasmius palmivorus]|uniref:Uncharacterized protein n=1 Tax=Paramarasmius palmivorus TaxID=297713 RepID=A0AAW0EC76_9AGAR